MRKIIRSLFYIEKSEKSEVAANYEHVRIDRLIHLDDTERAVLEWMLDFFARHHEAPSFEVVADHFDKIIAPPEVALLEDATAQTWHAGGSFETAFEAQVEIQGVDRFRATFKTANDIANDGIQVRPGVIQKGLADAVAHVFVDLQVPAPKDMKTAGGRINLVDMESAYTDLEKGDTLGVPTGYRLIDGLTGGTKRKSLYIHAGYAGHLKTTYIMNQCVRAVCLGWHVIDYTAEMPARELQFMAITIHSANPKFRGTHPPLNYRKVLLGKLDPTEKAFQRDVIADFETGKGHGTLRVFDSGVFATLGDIRRITSQEHVRTPVDLIWVDYLTRLDVDTKYARSDHTTAMNLTIKDLKQLAMSFDGGRGLAVGTGFQINREGFRRGKDNGGVLDTTALNQYNAAEKEADCITYSWFHDQERSDHVARIGMMKNRWGPVLSEPVNLYYDADCRLIHERAGMATSALSSPGLAVSDPDEVTI